MNNTNLTKNRNTKDINIQLNLRVKKIFPSLEIIDYNRGQGTKEFIPILRCSLESADDLGRSP